MKRLGIGIALVLLTAATLFAQDLTPIAVVKLNKSETITLKQLKSRINFSKKQYGLDLSDDQKLQIFDAMIQEKLIVQAAAKDGLTVADSQVDAAFLNVFAQQIGQQVTEAQLSDIIQKSTGKSLESYILENTGLTLSEYKAYLKAQLVAQQYIMGKYQNELKGVAATDAEIRNFYTLNKSQFVQDPMMKLFLVIVPKGSDAVSAKSVATDLRNKYKAGSSDEEKIKNSPDNGKKYQAGNTWVQQSATYAQMLGWSSDKLLELFKNNVGFVSEITETATDFQFYAVIRKVDGKNLGLSDVVHPEQTVTVYDYIKGNLTAQKQSEYLNTQVLKLASDLDTPANVERKKQGDALKALLK